MKQNDFALLMKEMEDNFTQNKVDPSLPICIRFDGKNFSTFTADLKRPFDERLTKIMTELTKYCLHIANADFAYTQSDEISLIILPDEFKTPIYQSKSQKMMSVLAGKVSVRFNKLLQHYLPEKYIPLDIDEATIKDEDDVVFDARMWNVPSVDAALDTFVWRMSDARKNSISMCVYASTKNHKEFLGMSSKDRLEYLDRINQPWVNHPEENKTGVIVMNKAKVVPYSEDEKMKMSQYYNNIPEFKIQRTFDVFTFPELLKKTEEAKVVLLEKRDLNKNVAKNYKDLKRKYKKHVS